MGDIALDETKTYDAGSHTTLTLEPGTYEVIASGQQGTDNSEDGSSAEGGYIEGTFTIFRKKTLELWVANGRSGRHNGGNGGVGGTDGDYYAGDGGGSTEIELDGAFLLAAEGGGGRAFYSTSKEGSYYLGGGGGARGGLGGSGDTDDGEDGEGAGNGGDGGDGNSSSEQGDTGGVDYSSTFTVETSSSGGGSGDASISIKYIEAYISSKPLFAFGGI